MQSSLTRRPIRPISWALLAFASLGLSSPVFADTPRIKPGVYKATGTLQGKASRSSYAVKHLEAKKYEVSRSSSMGDLTGDWSATGYDNGSRLTIEFKVLSTDGLVGALRGDGASSNTTIRAVFKFNEANVTVDLYEVRPGKKRRLIGTEAGTLSTSADTTGGDSDTGTAGSDTGSTGSDTGSSTGGAGWGDGNNGGTGTDASTGTDTGANTGSGSDTGTGTEGGATTGTDANGNSTTEGGSNSEVDPANDLKITSPSDGAVVLVGSRFEARLDHPTATLEATGVASVTDRVVSIRSAGEFTLQASLGTTKGPLIHGRAITAEIVEISQSGGLPISDSPAPQVRRKLGDQSLERSTPVAILLKDSLRLSVKIAASEDLSDAAQITLVGRSGNSILVGDASVKSLKKGEAVEVRTAGQLNTKVAINKLDIEWSVAAREDVKTLGAGDSASYEVKSSVALAGGKTALRVYTSYGQAVRNITIGAGTGPKNTSFHYERACEWANGASRNIGKGSDSIAWNADNQMRHYVHPKDYGNNPPEIKFYGPDQKVPMNYDDLPRAYSVRNGVRPISSLYYPPLEVKKEYEEYENYRQNFGWWVLDNPNYVGGRCNQQASLICDIVGLLGIKASVHYLQRVGTGRRSYRPVRMYFYAAGGSGPWNFHGIVRAEMEEGEWLYDGCFSSPPNRLNGERSWAEAPGGPFIEKWAYWLYDDVPYSERVPENDIPKTWDGIQ